MPSRIVRGNRGAVTRAGGRDTIGQNDLRLVEMQARQALGAAGLTGDVAIINQRRGAGQHLGLAKDHLRAPIRHQNRMVNRFQPSPFMLNAGKAPKAIPAGITRVLMHAMERIEGGMTQM